MSPDQYVIGAEAMPGTAVHASPLELDIPPDRREVAAAHAAAIGRTAQQIAAALPLAADVDDFRRILVAAASDGDVDAE